MLKSNAFQQHYLSKFAFPPPQTTAFSHIMLGEWSVKHGAHARVKDMGWAQPPTPQDLPCQLKPGTK